MMSWLPLLMCTAVATSPCLAAMPPIEVSHRGCQRLLPRRAGTFPLQSERMYAALQGNGCPCRLVLLPLESHGYRAWESVMHVLAENEAWLERFCPAHVQDSRAGAVSDAGGVARAAALA